MTQDWKRQREAQRRVGALPMSIDNLRKLLIRAVELGNLDITSHFKQRCLQRGFTTLDAENVVRSGQITVCERPWFDAENDHYRMTVKGKIEGKTLEIGIGLDPSVDYQAPLVSFNTVMGKGGSNVGVRGKKNETREGDTDEKV
jgi:hypothetical protein